MPKQKLKAIAVTLFIVFQIHCLNAQLEYSGVPHYSPLADSNLYENFEIEANANSGMVEKLADGAFLKKSQFGYEQMVDISPELMGNWKVDGQGCMHWLLKITVNDAKSLNLIFEPFELKEGVKVFIYDKGQKQVLGAYNHKSNKSFGLLATSPILGSEVYIEMQLAKGVFDYGHLKIGRLGIQPNEPSLKGAEDRYFGWSQDCNVDINCSDQENHQLLKKASCRIVFNGTLRCTGTLINNGGADSKPYVLTAHHCISTQESANTAVFYFNYESPECSGGDGELHSISGGTLLATGPGVDFSLIELSSKPPASYEPYYAGWDARAMEPASSTYTIHHPEGDVKKISTNFDQLQHGSFISTGEYDPNKHWLLASYEEGTTERGSSGAALMDENNRVIGTLSAGGAACSNPIYDYYQKLTHSWDDYPSDNQQLKNWLAPSVAGQEYSNGFLPFQDITYLANYTDDQEKKLGNLELGWGYLTGHNYHEQQTFAEQFQVRGSKYVLGVQLDPAIAEYGSLQSSIELMIWEGNEKPGKLIYQETVQLHEIDPLDEYRLMLDTALLVNYNFFIGYKLNYAQNDTFAVKYVEAINNQPAWVKEEGVWQNLREEGAGVNAGLCIKAIVADKHPDNLLPFPNPDIASLFIYPNPTDEFVQILASQPTEGDAQIRVFDMQGRLIMQKEYIDPEPNIPLDVRALKMGIYLVEVKYANVKQTAKLLVK